MVNPDLVRRLEVYKLGKKLLSENPNRAVFIAKDMIRHPQNYHINGKVILCYTNTARAFEHKDSMEKYQECLEKHNRKKAKKQGIAYFSATACYSGANLA